MMMLRVLVFPRIGQVLFSSRISIVPFFCRRGVTLQSARAETAPFLAELRG
jgi:hypothetical protein